MLKVLSIIIFGILMKSAPIQVTNDLTEVERVNLLNSETKRYDEIAVAIANVATESSILESNTDADIIKKAALITAIAVTESRLDKKTQFGITRGDRGRSWCLMQMNIGKGKTAEGFTGEELVNDLNKCLLTGFNAAKRSMGACQNTGAYTDRLAAYTTGTCQSNEKHSRMKMNLMNHYYSKIMMELKKQGVVFNNNTLI